MYYVGQQKTNTSKNWRIRHGEKDKDTEIEYFDNARHTVRKQRLQCQSRTSVGNHPQW